MKPIGVIIDCYYYMAEGAGKGEEADKGVVMVGGEFDTPADNLYPCLCLESILFLHGEADKRLLPSSPVYAYNFTYKFKGSKYTKTMIIA